MRRTQGNYNASAKKSISGDRNMSNPPKNSSAFHELDDYSEMNQSIKMSYNQPKYHEGKNPSMGVSSSPLRSGDQIPPQVPRFGEMME